MKNYILLGVLFLCITACTALENYQFGDATRLALTTASKVIALKKEYCSSDNEESRGIILNSIRLVDPTYDGVCDADSEQSSNSGEDQTSSDRRSFDRDNHFYGYGQSENSGASERMWIGTIQVRLRPGHYVWSENIDGVFYTRYRLYRRNNIQRQDRCRYAVFDEPFSDHKQCYRFSKLAHATTAPKTSAFVL